MKVRSLLVVALCLVGMMVIRQGYAQDDRTVKAEAANSAWLALMDAGKYDDARTAAAAVVRAAVSKEAWSQTMVAVRTPLGKVEQRSISSAQFTKSLPGSPDGEYVVTEYKTHFAHKADAVETVVTSKETDGVWRVSGYHFK